MRRRDGSETNDSGKEIGAVSARKAPFMALLAAHARAAARRLLVVRRRAALGQHLVDQAVGLRFLGIHEKVTLHVGADLLDRLAGALGVNLVQLLTRLPDLAGV